MDHEPIKEAAREVNGTIRAAIDRLTGKRAETTTHARQMRQTAQNTEVEAPATHETQPQTRPRAGDEST